MIEFNSSVKTISDFNSNMSNFSDMKSMIDFVRNEYGAKNISYNDEASVLSFTADNNMPYTVQLKDSEKLNLIHSDVMDVLTDKNFEPVFVPKYSMDELRNLTEEVRNLYYPINKEVTYNSSKKILSFINEDSMTYYADLSTLEVFSYYGDVYVLKTAIVEFKPKYTIDDLKSVFEEIITTFGIEKADIDFEHGSEIGFSTSTEDGYTIMDYMVDLSDYEVFIYGDNPYVPNDTIINYIPKYTMEELIPLKDYISAKYPNMSQYLINKNNNMLIFEHNSNLYTIAHISDYVYKINNVIYIPKENTLNLYINEYKSVKKYFADLYLIEENDIQYSNNGIIFSGINGVTYTVDFSKDSTWEFLNFSNDIYVSSQYNNFAVPIKTNSLPKNYYRTIKQIQQLTGLSLDSDIVQDERYYILVRGNVIHFDSGVIYSKYDTLYTTAEDFKNGLEKAFPINVRNTLESMGFASIRNNSGTAIYAPIGYNTQTKKITLFGVDLDIENAISLGESGNRNTDSILGPVLIITFGKAFSSDFVNLSGIKNYICAKYNFNASECSLNGDIITFKGYSFTVRDAKCQLGSVYFVRKEFIESNVDNILRKVIADNKYVKLFSTVLDLSEDLSNEIYYDKETRTLHVGVSQINGEDLILNPDISEADYTSPTDFAKAAVSVSQDSIDRVIKENEKTATTIIAVPIDSRPVSNQNFKLLTEIGGDDCVVITKGLDEGFPIQSDNTPIDIRLFDLGNSTDTCASLSNEVSNIQGNKTIIINTPSCFTNGLIGSRMPTSYYSGGSEAEMDTSFRSVSDDNPCINNWIAYISELRDTLNSQDSSSRIYVHCPIPRTKPGQYMGNCTYNRPGNNSGTWAEKAWDFTTDHKGLSYFYSPNDASETSCTDILREWSYLENKYLSTVREDGSHALLDYEWNCLVHYNEMYRYDDAPCKNDIFNAYHNLFINAEYFITKLMDLVAKNVIDELVIGIDDIEFPDFYKNIGIDSNSVKYSFAQTCLDNIKAYHANNAKIKDNINDSIECCAEHINYLLGTDEIPQLIYARDLTRRMHRTPKYINYALSGTGTMDNTTGSYDINTINDILRKTQNFITNTKYYYYDDPNEYSKPRDYLNNAVYEIGEMHTFVRCNEKCKTDETATTAAKSIYNAFNDAYADSSYSSPRKFNNGNINMCLLDSSLEDTSGSSQESSNYSEWFESNAGADWLLLHTMKDIYKNNDDYSRNSISQLSAYSAWNTVGNSLGLGLAHSQVFAIIDSIYDNMTTEKAKKIITAHIKLLATHMLEDALYNRMKSKRDMFEDSYSSEDALKDDEEKIISILTGLQDKEFDNNTLNYLYGGYEWVINRFKDVNTVHRFNNYTVNTLELTNAELPWKRKFECRLSLNANVTIS